MAPGTTASSTFLLLVVGGLLQPTSTTGTRGEQLATVVQVCRNGYFRSEQNNCLPCNCKGHADSCEDITGICIDCQDHSTGDFCERCQDGFILDTSHDGHECRPCACPLATTSNNFAVLCDQRGSTLQCLCQEGHAGNYCERCAPGYYGNPMVPGDFCKKCDCNGNSDPNLIFDECHNVTGVCLNCWGDTAGDYCERCAPGFYGDAISAKDCRECQCNECGTASCDDRTGVCHCKLGVTGPLCDQCEDGYFGFSSCMGCRKCQCAIAAFKPTCDPHTLSCQCHPGAGGRYCERCLPGYWGYSSEGCTRCDCAGRPCDIHTGECLPETAVSTQGSVCNSCDECIWYLIGDIRLSNKTLDEIKVSVINISTGAAANDRLKYYNYTALQLKSQFLAWRDKSDLMRRETWELERDLDGLSVDVDDLEVQESSVKALGRTMDEDTSRSFTLANEVAANLTSLNVLIEDMVSEWDQYSVHQDVDPEVIKQKTVEAENMVHKMRKMDLSPSEPIAMDESTKAHEFLRRVHQLEKKLMVTTDRIPPLRELLAQFTAKLSSAQNLLQEAQGTIHQTQDKNKVNMLKFQRNEALQQKLMETFEELNSTLQMAGNIIANTEDVETDLMVMVKNVTEFHAAIDGASQLLKEKTENISLADRDLVQRASDHAQGLLKLAEKLKRVLTDGDTNGFVQKALEASSVYDNIVKYIVEANSSSVTTMNLAERAFDAVTGINTQLGRLKTESSSVFGQSVILQSEEDEVEKNVIDNVKYIEETKETMVEAEGKLKAIMEGISILENGKTTQRLQFAKEVAVGTLNKSAEVLQSVSPMAEKIEEWSRNMDNNEYSTAAYERAINTASETVSNLFDIMPQLLDKLRVVEEKRPANVSTNIMRIRELIAQARSVAKKVQVSMKFNGQSSVEVQPPTNVEDLKTVTSVSLYMRVEQENEPIQDRLVFYLGDRNGVKDYMGLVIRNGNLAYIYNLGGENVEISLSSKPVNTWPAIFNLVKVERLGRHGKVFLTVPSQSNTAEQKFIQKGEAHSTDSLLDLDANNTVFYLGGVPTDVRLPPKLNLPPFVGCIELASLNNDVISLYHFKQTHNMDIVATPPCPRYKFAFSQSRVTSYLFDGTGYALVSNIERRGKFGIVTRFDIEVRTVVSDGILFLMVKEGNFFVLQLKNGFLHLTYDFEFSGGPVVMESNLTKLQINDARYHEVSIIYHHSKKIILLVDRSHVKSLENEKKTLPFSDIYIGGAPSSVLLSRPELSSSVGLRGCVKGFQFQRKDFNLLEEPGTIGISSGCPEDFFMSHKAYFNGESFLGSAAKISPFEDFEGGFDFRTLQPSGLLFYHSSEDHVFSISVDNGVVVLNCAGTEVKSNKKRYHDGRPHFLVASVTNRKCQLVIDDKDKQQKNRPASSPGPSSASVRKFYLGGSPTSSISNFTGCISYAYVSRQDRDIELEDFQKYTEKVQTSFQDCPMQKPPVVLQLKTSKSQPRKLSRDKPSPAQGSEDVQNDLLVPSTAEACSLPQKPQASHHAYHYGGTSNSRQEYMDIPESFSLRSHFSMSLKTNSSFGVVFYVSDKEEKNYMAAFLAHGKLVYTFNVGHHKIKIKSPQNLNDGAWHDVVFIREGNVGRLVIDGLTVLEDRAPVFTGSWHVSAPLYVGGTPPGRARKNIQRNSAYSLTVCVRDLQLDGQRLPSASHTFGVTPCFEGPSEAGTFFSDEGGYVVLDDSFNLGLKFELVLEVRPRVASGILLHVYTDLKDYLSMYMHQGEVVVVLNNGVQEFSTRVSPRQGICDGRWHRITVIRESSVVQLDVDSEVNHVVGPFNPRAADGKTPVFIGGAPATLLPQSLAATRMFTGCMRNVVINETPVSFSKAALVNGAVAVGSCPAA
ncbi:laminin subunit alpha-4 [Paramormyrops kingsleyae]|uniref:Laminin, alpha 4 n=1 Tax=Paramormyrops kingsleyae TaxID=1676925 RepID=A0A3B3Q417_9TELE|nr:laminin subunit alpha-4 isoform X1 [Paramormyrops kingsleyae]